MVPAKEFAFYCVSRGQLIGLRGGFLEADWGETLSGTDSDVMHRYGDENQSTVPAAS
jgi:hypothetical protein